MLLLMLPLAPITNAWGLAPLAAGGAPPCSKQNGTREFHSAVVQHGAVSALIVGIARRDASGCHQSAEVRIERQGTTKSFPLPSDAEDFEIVDFSPDGTKIFVVDEHSEDVQIAAMPIATGELRWQDIADLLGWKDCEAMAEPLGFTVDGRPAVRARHSVMSPPKRPDCVTSNQVYTFDPHWKPAPMPADAASIKRFGKKLHPATQACQTDPDLAGACFSFRGRLTAWNGNPTFRIWRIGTKRMLGVTDHLFPADEVVLPESLDGKVSFDVEAYGDFLVCPLTTDTPGKMQMVCVESASDLIFKDR